MRWKATLLLSCFIGAIGCSEDSSSPLESEVDASPDVWVDDASTDGFTDTKSDTSTDAGSDATADTSMEANADSAFDALADATADGNGDVFTDPWAATKAIIADQMSQRRFPGLSVAVIRGSDVVWKAGFGFANVEQATAVTPDTAFQLASVSKMVVGAAVMRTIEQGDLTLDSPINSILPFAVNNPQATGSSIQLLHLVTHTSGIADNWTVLNPLYVAGDSTVTLNQLLSGYLVPGGAYYDAAKNFLPVEPGSEWNYSNIGATLAAYTVEVASGVAFDAYCKTNIFLPLQMNRTGWHLADFPDTNVIALPYSDNGTTYSSYGLYGYPDYPDGALRTSASDLARFLGAVMNDGTFEGAQILTPGSVQVLLSPLVPSAKSGQGVFWMTKTIGQRNLLGSEGSEAGVFTAMRFSATSHVGAIVLTNVDWTQARSAAMNTILTSIFDAAETL